MAHYKGHLIGNLNTNSVDSINLKITAHSSYNGNEYPFNRDIETTICDLNLLRDSAGNFIAPQQDFWFHITPPLSPNSGGYTICDVTFEKPHSNFFARIINLIPLSIAISTAIIVATLAINFMRDISLK